MKILSEKQLVQIENETLNKIYKALQILHQRDNSEKDGVVTNRHDELLDIALDVFSMPAQDERKYPWIRVSARFNEIFFPKCK